MSAPQFYDINTDTVRDVTQADVDFWMESIAALSGVPDAVGKIEARKQANRAYWRSVTSKAPDADDFARWETLRLNEIASANAQKAQSAEYLKWHSGLTMDGAA